MAATLHASTASPQPSSAAPSTITRAPTRSTDPSPKGSKRKPSPRKPSTTPAYADERRRRPEDPVEEHDPDGDAAHEERRHPGRDRLLGPGEPPVSDEEQQAAEDERRADLPPADGVALAIAARERKREQEASRDDVAGGHREESGGRSRTRIASAMNVDPQTRYTVPGRARSGRPAAPPLARMAEGSRVSSSRPEPRLDNRR